jgi:glycosyltransferase involved in cell wall biosynthesis
LRRSINLTSHLDLKFGGISAAVPSLAEATVLTHRYSALTVGFCEATEAVECCHVDNVTTLRLPIDRYRPLGDLHVNMRLSPIIAECDVVHIHGLWRAHCAAAGRIAVKHRIPFIVSAHGMLDDWAFHNKRWKKTIYSAVIERPNLEKAACLRALTRVEVDNYRAFGLRNPVALIPNGVSPPPQFSAQRFFERHPKLEGLRLVLFLSRIHYKKGTDLLCRAWASIASQFPDAHLVFAGPDFDSTLQKTRSEVQQLHIQERVTFAGMLSGPDKWAALAAATVFVLPSWSEGFSVATLEALAASRPVIITHQCNFPEIASEKCGWLIQPDVGELEAALSEALSLPQSSLDRLGENGRDYVAGHYSWPHIGAQMTEVYDWVLGGPRPTHVEVFE